MMRSSAFMRGEGTRAEVSRSTALFRAWRSCTTLFHHRDTEAQRKTKRQTKRELERHTGPESTAAPRTTNDERPATVSHHARRFLLELLGLIVRGQGIDHRLQ